MFKLIASSSLNAFSETADVMVYFFFFPHGKWAQERDILVERLFYVSINNFFKTKVWFDKSFQFITGEFLTYQLELPQIIHRTKFGSRCD